MVIAYWQRSADAALRFAFGMLAREVSVPSVFASLLTRSHAANELSMLELRGQAALLRGEVEALHDPVARGWLVACYLPRPVLEVQAGGGLAQVDHWNDERREAVNAVAWWLMGQAGTGAHRIRGYREIVSQVTLNRPSSRRLRELWKCDANTVRDRRDGCKEALDHLHTRAVAIYDARLVEKGILEATT